MSKSIESLVFHFLLQYGFCCIYDEGKAAFDVFFSSGQEPLCLPAVALLNSHMADFDTAEVNRSLVR